MESNESKPSEETTLKEKIAGLGQKIIGEAELIGGILSADPNIAGEGEFNLEVGDLRQDIAEELEKSEAPDRDNCEKASEEQ
ncbi:MAG: hypothetical protein ACK42A_04830 [Pyrinomonadaceae bacterium]